MNLLIGLLGVALAFIGFYEIGEGLEQLHPAVGRVWDGFLCVTGALVFITWSKEDKKK